MHMSTLAINSRVSSGDNSCWWVGDFGLGGRHAEVSKEMQFESKTSAVRNRIIFGLITSALAAWKHKR